MPCYTPGRSRTGQVVSCGSCLFCRLKYSGEWAVRCVHEASLYSQNSFITLTYDDKRLPDGYDIRDGLIYSHIQDNFLKALRDRCGGLTKVKHHNFGKINSKTGLPYPEFHRPIRFYVSGEYGDKRQRPHWHMLLFNFDFSDRYFWRFSKPNEFGSSKSRFPIYRSPTLEELWPYGNSEIGSVTFQSAGYCARYIMKKRNGDDNDHLYRIVDDDTGQVFIRRREFCKMSTRPGIASGWFDKFSSDVYPLDAVILPGGRKVKPPRFYDKKFLQKTGDFYPVAPFFDPRTGELFEDFLSPELDNIKFDRMVAVKVSLDNPDRPSLLSEKLCLEAKLSRLKRVL